MPFVYVSRFHISGHWDPDALARWYTMIPTCRLVHKGEPPAQKLLLDYRTGAGNSGGKARSRLKEWITSVLDYYGVRHLRRSSDGNHNTAIGFYFRMILKDNCCISI